jgi:hypothetical protein
MSSRTTARVMTVTKMVRRTILILKLKILTKPVRLIPMMRTRICTGGLLLQYDVRQGLLKGPERYRQEEIVGAGIGGGFSNSREIHVMKYKQAMKTKDKDKWDESIFEEHERTVNIYVCMIVP